MVILQIELVFKIACKSLYGLGLTVKTGSIALQNFLYNFFFSALFFVQIMFPDFSQE